MDPGLTADEVAALRARLERLEQQQTWVTSFETLRRVQREAAEVRWRLGLIDDEEYAALDSFADGFDYEG